MSSECDKCGEHTLDCFCPKYTPKENDRFFYQGKFFQTEDEFWTFVQNFTHRKTNAEDFDSLFNMLKKDIWANLMLVKPESTNSDVRNLLDEVFMFFVKKLWDQDNE